MSAASTAKSRSSTGSRGSDSSNAQTRNLSHQKSWAAPSPQRTPNTSHSNGLNGRLSGQATPPSPARSSGPIVPTPDSRAHDRLLYLLANFAGLDAVLTLKNGSKYHGMFSGATSSPARYIMKMVRPHDKPGTFIGQGDDHIMSFDVQDTIDLAVAEVSLTTTTSKQLSGNKSGFRTDTEISRNTAKTERELHRWQPDAAHDVDLSLDSTNGSGGIGDWDQFATNEKLYNVQSDFNEDLYTTVIDRSDPKYKQSEQRAARLAREIEREAASRPKVAEADAGLDEEDKYSGVIRTPALHGKAAQEVYVPPSRRLSNRVSAAGPPHDPAIISSQLARPNAPVLRNADSDRRIRQGIDSAVAAVSSAAAIANKNAAVPDTTKPLPGVAKAGQAPVPTKSESLAQDVYESFKQFSNAEKQRMVNHQRLIQQQRSTTARQEKSVKLNDLKKFSQNFKLHSRVPEDLVPILAKSKEKQDLIRVKAEQQARDKEQSVDATNNKVTSDTTAGTKPTASRGQLETQKSDVPIKPASTLTSPSPAGHSTDLASRLGSTFSKGNSKLSVKALEFRPNPGAAAFAPSGVSSPRAIPSQRPSISSPSPVTLPQAPPAHFTFGRPPIPQEERHNLFDEYYNPIKLMLQDSSADETKKSQYAINGGIPQAYRTAPTWDVPAHLEDKSYTDFFPKSATHTPLPGSRTHSSASGMMSHQHQLPMHMHLQSGPSPGQQSPRFFQAQPQYAHMSPDEQRAHFNQLSNGSMLRSYKNSPQSMMYNGQMHPQMQGGFAYGSPGGVHMRPQGSNGQFMGSPMAPMGGHMMMQQASNGPYPSMVMQQQQAGGMYASPGPHSAQPHLGGHNGYSGSPRSHPMSHQNSHQSAAGYGMPMMGMPGQSGQNTPIRHANQAQHGGQYGPQSHAMQQRVMSGQGTSHSTARQQQIPPQAAQIASAMARQQSNTGEEQR